MDFAPNDELEYSESIKIFIRLIETIKLINQLTSL